MVDAFCRKLGKGESEAVVVAIEHSADLVILDDHVAREETIRVGLNVKAPHTNLWVESSFKNLKA